MTTNMDVMAAERRLRPTRVSGEQTRKKILNAAEALFAEFSFDSVSMRDITQKADVTLALASYHFGSKEALFEAVVARRADILCRLREERLNALRRPTTGAVLDAFMAPLFEMARSGEPGWQYYLRVLARLGEHERWLELLARHFDPTARLFLQALQTSLPRARAPDVARGFVMALEVMLRTVSTHRRLDNLTAGRTRADAPNEAYPALLRFVTAGLQSFNRSTA